MEVVTKNKMKFHFEDESAIFIVLLLKVNILFVIYHSEVY